MAWIKSLWNLLISWSDRVLPQYNLCVNFSFSLRLFQWGPIFGHMQYLWSHLLCPLICAASLANLRHFLEQHLNRNLGLWEFHMLPGDLASWFYFVSQWVWISWRFQTKCHREFPPRLQSLEMECLSQRMECKGVPRFLLWNDSYHFSKPEPHFTFQLINPIIISK